MAQDRGIEELTHEAGDLYRRPFLPDELDQFDAAVIDPPRAGAEAQVHALARSGIRKIAYVSCNPVNFARDSTILKRAGCDLVFVQTSDQFLWSPHIELIGAFSKE